jgi:hypothetical protein
MLRLCSKNGLSINSGFDRFTSLFLVDDVVQKRQINLFGYELFGKKPEVAPREPSFSEQQQTRGPQSPDEKRDEMRATNKYYQKARARKIPVKHIIAISSGKVSETEGRG